MSLCLFVVSSPQTVGVIIRLDRDMFSVLNQHGKVSSELPWYCLSTILSKKVPQNTLSMKAAAFCSQELIVYDQLIQYENLIQKLPINWFWMEGWKFLTQISAESPLNNRHGLHSGFSKGHDECNFLPSFSSLQRGFWGNFALREGETLVNSPPSAPLLVFIFFLDFSSPYLPVQSLFTGYVFSLSITKIILFSKVTKLNRE